MRADEYTDADGVPWTFAERRRVRQEEAGRFVVIIATSPFETRIIRCVRERWTDPAPDFARLLAESVPSGGSRGSGGHPRAELDEEPFD